jgi:hypothetical protein
MVRALEELLLVQDSQLLDGACEEKSFDLVVLFALG